MEITWSLMHPTPLDPDYFEEVLDQATRYRVDGFELCGDCHGSTGGLDGCLSYADFPSVAARRCPSSVADMVTRLNRIVSLSHATGRSVYLWHREVVLPDGLVDLLPDLIDESGSFDFFGAAFARLIRYKLEAFFQVCPQVDGIVLTLTEADYGVIHHSDPVKYPPAKVVERITRLFLEILEPLGKRFILRSFGSVPSDYEAILDGTEAAAAENSFEIETKITPYDFVPFLRQNPFLRLVPGTTLGVEIDIQGEFLGAGYLPAFNVRNLIRYVAEAREAGASRLSLRLDRVGCRVFSSGYEINLDIIQRAVDKGASARASDLIREAVLGICPGAPAAFEQFMETAYDAITGAFYVDGTVMFHTTPLRPELRIVQAGGLPGVLKGGRSLKKLDGIWSVRGERTGPERKQIMDEKRHASVLAINARHQLEGLRGDLPDAIFRALEERCTNLCLAAGWIERFVDFLLLALEGLETCRDVSEQLARDLDNLAAEIGISGNEAAAPPSNNLFAARKLEGGARQVWGPGLLSVMAAIQKVFAWELAQRVNIREQVGVEDFLIAGGLCDDWRINRQMHASRVVPGACGPVREIGNAVFPNGFVETELYPAVTDPVRLRFDCPERGRVRVVVHDEEGKRSLDPAPSVLAVSGGREVRIETETLPNGRAALRLLTILRHVADRSAHGEKSS